MTTALPRGLATTSPPLCQGDSSQDSLDARSGLLTSTLLLCWIIGTIFLGKSFAYLRVGPLFVTELTLGALLLSNITRFRTADLLLGAAVIVYVAIGTVRHGSFLFAGKDIAWMYYLYFLRFFPRNFPQRFVDIVVGCCFFKAMTLLTLPHPIIPKQEGYHEAIVVLFSLSCYTIHRGGRIGWPMYFLFLVITVLVKFKTLIIVMLVTPFAIAMKIPWQKILAPRPLLAFVAVLIVAILQDYTRIALQLSVDVLNAVGDLLRLGEHYLNFNYETSHWRAAIWTQSLAHLLRDGEFLFGQFPGYNFLHENYLGVDLKDAALSGKQGFGVVRTAHNIVVQMIMKAGIAGLCIYGWYFFKHFKAGDPIPSWLVASVFLMSLTGDILEVPSRGPLFYCLLVLLLRFQAENTVPVPQSPARQDGTSKRLAARNRLLAGEQQKRLTPSSPPHRMRAPGPANRDGLRDQKIPHPGGVGSHQNRSA